MRTSFRVAGAAAGVVLSLGAALQVPAADADTPALSTEIVVQAAADADLAAAAEADVAAMSASEQAASVVMGHIPTTDAATLRSYMETTGIGGFILMGANIPADEAGLRALTAALTIDPARSDCAVISVKISRSSSRSSSGGLSSTVAAASP